MLFTSVCGYMPIRFDTQRVTCTEAATTQTMGYNLQSEVPSSSNSNSDSINYSIGKISYFSESEKSESDHDSDGNQEVDMVDDDRDDMHEGEENEENIPTSKQSNFTHAEILSLP